MLSIGIVGLPNVGKSTIFKAVTSAPAEASNYPFCTIDPNVGIVTVPDERLQQLFETVHAKKTVPAAIEFVDIAGLIKGASTGEGLGNKFLSHIRECDAIAEVVRLFEDEDIIHVDGKVDPESDTQVIAMELALADLASLEKQLTRLRKEVRADPKRKGILEGAEKIAKVLEEGRPARSADLTPDEVERAYELHLLTMKPHLYIANLSEEQLQEASDSGSELSAHLKSLASEVGSHIIPICAKVESELAELDDEEAAEYRSSLGYTESGLAAVIREGYALLGLQSYFTAGEQEVRAWTIPIGATAPQAAGVIHTDFERGFIKAEVVYWEELVKQGSWAAVRSSGTARMEGKDYVMRDGDVALFRFNV